MDLQARANDMGRKSPRGQQHRSTSQSLGAGGRASAKRASAAVLFETIVKCHEDGRLSEAIPLYVELLAIEPNVAGLHCNYGVALAELGRLSDAEAAYRRAIAIDPRLGDAHNNLGNVFSDLGKWSEAEGALRQAVRLKPQSPQCHSNLGTVLKAQGKLQAAEAVYRAAIALRPDFAEAHSNLGDVLTELGKPSEAEQALRRAIALKPDLAEAYNNLGVLLRNLGRLAEARDAGEEAIRLLPRNASYHLNLSDYIRFAPGDPQLAAMEALADDIDALPEKQQIELQFALAKAYDDIGRHEDAFRNLLAANAQKRRQIAYDETATFASFAAIRSVFTPELMHAFAGAGDPTSTPVFIIGMPRSGSTLIEQIVASHPQVFGAGELSFLDGLVTAKCAKTGAAFPQGVRALTRADFHNIGSGYVTALSDLTPAATRITDKMPSNFLLAGLIHLALPNATIIHAVRDPLDTCLSCFSKLFASGQSFSYDLAELGRYYRHYRALMDYWHRLLPPGRILDVHYEDVVANLEGEARRIIAHCGLAWDSRCLAFHETERLVMTASAAQVRREIYRSAIGRAQACKAFLGPLVAELGV
jgi:tetratricopeptide (TPR) repeat protein